MPKSYVITRPILKQNKPLKQKAENDDYSKQSSILFCKVNITYLTFISSNIKNVIKHARQAFKLWI
jgi:hypothetical protein